MDYILYGVPSQSDEREPLMRLTADGMDSVPTSVTPYDPEDESLVALTQELIRSIQKYPEDNTVSRIALSYGGLTDGNGERIDGGSPAVTESTYTILFSEYPTLAPMPDRATPVVWITGTEGLPPVSIEAVSKTPVALALTEWARHEERQGRTVAEIIETFRGAHTWVVDGRIPDSILSGTPLEEGDDIRANEDLIPQWEEAYEINAQAMQAATDFLKVAGEIRESLTYVPPQGLADWLRRNPEVLRGDDELPDHIHAAADALEGLPAAILRDEVPNYYDGHAGEFLGASERVFRSVTRRLERITPLQVLDPG